MKFNLSSFLRLLPLARMKFIRTLKVTGALLLVGALGTACAATQGVSVPGSIPPKTVAIPSGSQIGTGIVPMSCQLPILGNTTFIVSGTGAVTTALGPNQQFYLTDVRGSLEVPSAFMSLASLVGATTVSASVTTLNIDATNATPAVLNAAATPITITNIPVVNNQSETVTAPPNGSLNIGPFTAGTSGLASLSIGNVAVTITLLNSSGATVLFPLTITCSAPSPTVVLVGLTINSSLPSTPPSEITGVNATAFTVPVGYVEGSLNAPLSCNVSGIGTVTLNGTLTAELPAYLPAGQPFYFQDASGSLVIPKFDIDYLILENPTAVAMKGSITDLELNSVNATPANFNVASPALPIATTPISGSQGATIDIPSSGTLQVGPLTASTSGYTTITWGTSGGSIELLDAQGNQVGPTINVSCAPPVGPITVLDEPITTGAIPQVSSVSPTSGPVAGGTQITITGSGFTGAVAVNIGNGQATYVINSDTQITATVPAGDGDGVNNITVLGPNGPSVLGSNATYTYTG